MFKKKSSELITAVSLMSTMAQTRKQIQVEIETYTANKSSRSIAKLLQFTIDSSNPLRSVSILTAADRCAPYSVNICCVIGLVHIPDFKRP